METFSCVQVFKQTYLMHLIACDCFRASPATGPHTSITDNSLTFVSEGHTDKDEEVPEQS